MFRQMLFGNNTSSLFEYFCRNFSNSISRNYSGSFFRKYFQEFFRRLLQLFFLSVPLGVSKKFMEKIKYVNIFFKLFKSFQPYPQEIILKILQVFLRKCLQKHLWLFFWLFLREFRQYPEIFLTASSDLS